MPAPKNRSVLLAVAFTLVALGCSRGTKGDEALTRAIVAETQKSDGDVIIADVPRVTDFTWDNVFVFAPHTPADKVRQELGTDWPEAGRIEKHDDFTLLVFVSQGKVVRFVDVPRASADFAPAARKGGYSHSDALFRCTKSPQGPRRCVVANGG
jgi:hypothetical protein